MFPAEVRYTGVAFGSQIATIIGGLVPMYATALFPIYGTLPVSLLVIGCAVISLIALASIGLPAPDRVRAMLNEV
jgi:hypothetical protein